MNFLFGADNGNSKTEVVYKENGILNYVRQPSVISHLYSKPEIADLEENYIIENLSNNLAVHIISNGLKHDGLFYVGEKALSSGEKTSNMNISLGDKSSNDIPLICSLSLISSIAIQKHYKENNQLPKSLDVEVKLASAIPSSEYTKEAARHLENRFLHEHTIKVYIGEKTVTVNVNVTACKVTEEGKTAMLAFMNSDDSILRHYNETYKLNASTEDFSEALSLHADIGDGTSEFTFTEGYNPVPNSSEGKRLGVGHATTNAIKLYKSELKGMVGDINRQQFMKLLFKDSPKSTIAKEEMTRATRGQALDIIEQIKESYATKTSSSADYFFIHGGGSIVFKEHMYDDLIEFVEKVQGKVVWIPEEFATRMISTGNYYLAEALFEEE